MKSKAQNLIEASTPSKSKLDKDVDHVFTLTIEYAKMIRDKKSLNSFLSGIKKIADKFGVNINDYDSEGVYDATSEEEPLFLHVSDWNYQDKYYRVNAKILKKMKSDILSLLSWKSIKDVWNDFIGINGYEGDNSVYKSVKRVGVTGADKFLDYNNPIESVKEWEL